MRIAVTGATGFIGVHVRNVLAKSGHDVVLVVRNVEKVGDIAPNEKLVVADLSHERKDWLEFFEKPDVVLHLAWGGLPNYTDSYHMDIELPVQLRFLKAIIEAGLKKLVVAGTCYEYGLLSGALSEDQETFPVTPYGMAKDNLRRVLFALRSKQDFEITWARIFYPYGEGQSEKSLYSQLKSAILLHQDFLMGSGQQVLDFIHVEKVATTLLHFVTTQNCSGLVNVGSGKPQSVVDFVKGQIQSFNSGIVPQLGRIPAREYEPVSFWSNNSRLDSLIYMRK